MKGVYSFSPHCIWQIKMIIFCYSLVSLLVTNCRISWVRLCLWYWIQYYRNCAECRSCAEECFRRVRSTIAIVKCPFLYVIRYTCGQFCAKVVFCGFCIVLWLVFEWSFSVYFFLIRISTIFADVWFVVFTI